MKYPGQRGQIDVKFVPASCLVGEAEGQKFYQYTFIDEYSSAIMFSLIQTAIENGLDPYKYLTWLMKTAKDTDLSQEDTIQTLLPWNAPVECKNRSKE